jgi:hypothetical protein
MNNKKQVEKKKRKEQRNFEDIAQISENQSENLGRRQSAGNVVPV